MSYPLDSRVLSLLSVFDDSSSLEADRYRSTTPCDHQRYVRHARAGDLTVTVWTHSGTAWVTLEGLLERRACHGLAKVLMRADAPDIVLNVAGLELPSQGGTPLVGLCATLSYAGHSVSVVGRDDEQGSGSGDALGGRRELLMVADESA